MTEMKKSAPVRLAGSQELIYNLPKMVYIKMKKHPKVFNYSGGGGKTPRHQAIKQQMQNTTCGRGLYSHNKGS